MPHALLRARLFGRLPVIYTAVLAACAIIGALLLWRPFHTPLRTFITPPKGARLAGLPAVSPDGARLACPMSENGQQELWLIPARGGGGRKVAGSEGARLPFWSADGSKVAFYTTNALKMVDTATGAVRLICAATRSAKGGAWNASGQIVFTPSADGPLYRVSDRGGAPEPITTLNAAAGETSHGWPQFLPDGRLLYSAFSAAFTDGQVYLRSGGQQQAILRAPGRVLYTPASGGMLVYSRNGRLLSVHFDIARSAITGAPELLAPFVGYAYCDSTRLFAAGPTQIVYAAADPDRSRRLVWIDRNGRRLGTLGDAGRYSLPRISPDGRFVLVGTADAADNSAIRLFEVGTGNQRVVYSGKKGASNPVWSGDNTTYFFSTGEDDKSAIVKANVQQTGTRSILVSTERRNYPLDYSAAAGLILFAAVGEQSAFDIWTAPPARGPNQSQSLLLRSNGTDSLFHARLSPDARWIAFVQGSDKLLDYNVYAAPFSSGHRTRVSPAEYHRVSAAGGADPEWSPDGTRLFYIDAAQQFVAVQVQEGGAFQTRPAQALFSLRGSEDNPLEYQPGFGYSLMPDGSRFLFNMGTAEADNELTVLRR
jgi:Tol biopolymer transport system component